MSYGIIIQKRKEKKVKSVASTNYPLNPPKEYKRPLKQNNPCH
jgi:hypothetical protein